MLLALGNFFWSQGFVFGIEGIRGGGGGQDSVCFFFWNSLNMRVGISIRIKGSLRLTSIYAFAVYRGHQQKS